MHPLFSLFNLLNIISSLTTLGHEFEPYELPSKEYFTLHVDVDHLGIRPNNEDCISKTLQLVFKTRKRSHQTTVNNCYVSSISLVSSAKDGKSDTHFTPSSISSSDYFRTIFILYLMWYTGSFSLLILNGL